MAKPQNYANHASNPFPYVANVVLVVTATVGSGVLLIVDFSAESLALFVVAFCTATSLKLARRFSCRVQDRVIRLEERLRMERVLPDELKGEIERLTTGQLIGLRFASDAELTGLVRRVLAGELTSRESIKQAVEHWRADDLRI